MVGAGAGTLLAADRRHALVEQVAEEFPAGRRLVEADAELFGDPVGGPACRHRTGDTGKPLGVARRQMRIGGQHRQAVGRRDEDAAADDEVAVAVTVGGCAEIGRIGRHHRLVERAGVHQVRVRVVAAEVRQRNEVHHRALGCARAFLDDLLGVRPGDGAHGVEDDAEAARDQLADGCEVEQAFHQLGVVGHRIDDGHRHAVDLLRTFGIEVDVGDVRRLVAVDHLAAGIDRVGDLFRCRAAIADIVFDAEIFRWAAGIVAGREHNTAKGLVFADDVGGGRRRQNAATADEYAAEAVRRRHLDGDLDDFAVVVAAVAADHQCFALKAFERIEDRLDEVLGIVLLLEDRDLLAQPRRARLLVAIGGCGNRSYHADLTFPEKTGI
ncbi:hypothetical protein D9M72_441710 [compost metagenome]